MTTLLTRTFHATFCTTPVPEAECACGARYVAEGDTPVLVGQFAGSNIVAGCHCKPCLHVANVLWGQRHQLAAFLRGTATALAEDQQRLVRVLPFDMGTPEGQDSPSAN